VDVNSAAFCSKTTYIFLCANPLIKKQLFFIYLLGTPKKRDRGAKMYGIIKYEIFISLF